MSFNNIHEQARLMYLILFFCKQTKIVDSIEELHVLKYPGIFPR